MAVDVQGRLDAGMAQPFLYNFGGYFRFEEYGGMRVPRVVEAYRVREFGRNFLFPDETIPLMADAIRRQWLTVPCAENEPITHEGDAQPGTQRHFFPQMLS